MSQPKIHCKYNEMIKGADNIANDEILMLFKGQRVLIDTESLQLFAKYAWYPMNKNGKLYLYRNDKPNGTTRSFHREIFSAIPAGLEIDHINGDSLDNRKRNLRIVTHKENQNNQKKRILNTTSKYRYVSFRQGRNKWAVYIAHDNSTKNVGSFKTEIEAAMVANEYIIKNKLDKRLNIL